MRCAHFDGSNSLMAAFAALWFCINHCGIVESKVIKAKAVIFKAVGSESDPSVAMGQVEFLHVEGGGVHITGALQGLEPAGQHGFHIHELGGYYNNCIAAGAHFNPHHQVHGAPNDAERHVGDLGNVAADPDGNAQIDITDSFIALNGPLSVIGRSVVVHERADDLGRGMGDSKNTGNAGKRLGCGIIGVEFEVAGETNSASSDFAGTHIVCLALLLLSISLVTLFD